MLITTHILFGLMSNPNSPKKVRIVIFAVTAATMVMTLVAASFMTAAIPQAYALHKADHFPQDDNPNSAKGTFPHGPFQACNRGATTNPSENLPAQCQ